MFGLAADTEIDVRTAGLTVNDVDAVTPSNVALIDELPIARADALPTDPTAFEIEAVAVFDDCPCCVTRDVLRRVVGEEPVAVNPDFPLGQGRIGLCDGNRYQRPE